LTLPLLARVDFRDGVPVAEFSRLAPPFFSDRLDLFLEAVDPLPALRSVALTPGLAVSIGTSLRGRAGRFGRGGLAARCCLALVAWDLVGMIECSWSPSSHFHRGICRQMRDRAWRSGRPRLRHGPTICSFDPQNITCHRGASSGASAHDPACPCRHPRVSPRARIV